jgi:hypothetical protein
LSGLNDFFVLDCEFARISVDGSGSGIDQVGCHRGLISGCLFTEGANPIQCKGGSDDIEIRSNRFLNPTGRAINIGGSTGFKLFRPPLSTNTPNFEARDIRVIANLFIGSEAPTVFAGAINCLAAHNTIINPNKYLLRILQESVSKEGYTFALCGQNQFLNNLVYFQSSRIGIACNIGGNTEATTFTFGNNLWFAHDRPDRSKPALPVAEIDGLYAIDPEFKSSIGGDYTLAASSPAIGKGKKLPNTSADFYYRCYATPPAIGAFEKFP